MPPTPKRARPSSGLTELYCDECVLVIDKPAGIDSVASEGTRGRTALDLVRVRHPTALAAHRIDRETSGVLVFALDRATLAALEEQFRARSIEKHYVALVRGRPQPLRGTIRRPIRDLGKVAVVRKDGEPAVTHYRVVETLGPASLVEVEIETGRYNQIRLHFASIGHPLIGERKYARGRESPVRFSRVALHASRIAFRHPRTGKRIEISAPLPAPLQALIERLRELRKASSC